MQELPNDREVGISTGGEPKPDTVVSAAATPRSYIVETPTGDVQRNRCQIRVTPYIPTERDPATAEGQEAQPRHVVTRSQLVKPPDRLA